MAEAQLPGTRPYGDGISTARPAAPIPERAETGQGWLTFAGVMFLVAATFNAVYGIAALANDDYFAADELLFGDLSMWGAFYLIVAASETVTALLVFARSSVGAVLGIILATLNATVALMSVGAYPLWSITVMVVDGLIIYGLTVYGFDQE